MHRGGGKKRRVWSVWWRSHSMTFDMHALEAAQEYEGPP